MDRNSQHTWVLLSNNVWLLLRSWRKPSFYFCCRYAGVNTTDRQTGEKFVFRHAQNVEQRKSVAVYNKKHRLRICFNDSGDSANWRWKFLEGGGSIFGIWELRYPLLLAEWPLFLGLVCRILCMFVRNVADSWTNPPHTHWYHPYHILKVLPVEVIPISRYNLGSLIPHTCMKIHLHNKGRFNVSVWTIARLAADVGNRHVREFGGI